eukprot:TRINITY_DN1255_c0_g1_i2.p2 TRINITY_DN1255_c0_g1~~TRINITY_DN1255_c0_g1_i2.p2  ORF type:complete len:68 (+),score=50.26 TRINITY_DN1255_c0_g1_i2:515-718(+)
MIANIRKDEHDLFICQELDDEDNQEKDVEDQGDAMDIDDEEDEKRDIKKKKYRLRGRSSETAKAHRG